jgi:hypothetical protein
MPSIRLGRYEVEEYELPRFCARCGEKAVVCPPKRFAWSPQWLPVLILLGLLGLALYVILALSLTKRMVVPLPFCERHRNYWRNRQIFIFGGLAAVVLIAAVAITLGAVLDNKRITDEALLITILGSVGLFLVWLVSAAVLQSLGIRPGEITDTSISLAGLSDEFVDAVRRERRADRDEEDEDDDRRRRRRPRYDDEDDDRPRARRRAAEDDDGGYDDRESSRRRRRADEDDGGYYDPDARRRRRDREDDEDDR